MSTDSHKLLSKFNILMPVGNREQAQRMLPLALALAGEKDDCVNLLAVAPEPGEAPLNEPPLAVGRLAGELDKIAYLHTNVRRLGTNLTSPQPWDDLKALVEERAADDDLLLLPWQENATYLNINLALSLHDAACNTVVAQAGVHANPIRRILLPIRGGPFAYLSLQLAVRLARSLNAEITLLRVLSSSDSPTDQFLRERFIGLSDAFPEITAELQVMGDATKVILRELQEHQAVILGASAVPEVSIGLLAMLVLQRQDVTALIVKTKEPFSLPIPSANRSNLPVLIKVEKWFATNTFHHRQFSDVTRLIDLKRKQGLRISLGLPSLNEEATVGKVIRTLKSQLMDDAPLLDEIILIDSNSTDATRQIAAELGVTTFVHQEVLPNLGSLRGKGEALWKSLYLLKGDLLLWIDTDIENPHPHFVYGILGPLLTDSRIQYVKGFYRRPFKADTKAINYQGGRVTELLARPIINLFFPELSGLIQPLAGIYGGRRTALEQVPFYSGYGVEIGLLLNLLDRVGLSAIAQVDLEEVVHRNQGLRALSKMSFAILQVFARHLQQRGRLDSRMEIERTMKILRAEEEHFYTEEVYVHEQQRLPMIEVREYRGRHRKRE